MISISILGYIVLSERGVDMEEITTALGRLSLPIEQGCRNSAFAALLMPDVLEYIFFFALPYLDETHKLSTAPTNASQVNRHWRAVALSSRRLWSTLLVETDRLPILTRYLSLFSLFLNRRDGEAISKRPLDFSIVSHPVEFVKKMSNGRWNMRVDVGEEVRAEGVSTVERYLDLLLPRRSTWRNARIALSTMAPKSIAGSTHWPWRLDDLKAIELFYLSYPPVENGLPGEPAIVDFSASALLQKACIRGHVDIHLSEGIKLENLVYLRLDLIGMHEYSRADAKWYHFLQHAPNLETLNVSLCRGGPFALLSAPVTLPRLRWLVVTNYGPESCMPMFAFLASIRCPELRCLEIVSRIRRPSVVIPWDIWTPFGLTLFFQQSGCRLLNLSIDSSIIDDNDLTSALRHVPTLRHLKIRRVRFPENALFIPYLALDYAGFLGDPEDRRCPDLETLVFRSCELIGKDCETVVGMASNRWHTSGSKLCYFEFSDCGLEGFDEHPTITGIRSSPRYWQPRLGPRSV